MTAIQTQTERKRQDRSVRRTEKLRRQPGMLRTFGPIRPTTGAFATSCNAQARKHLIDGRNQPILPSNGMPLGECQMKYFFALYIEQMIKQGY